MAEILRLAGQTSAPGADGYTIQDIQRLASEVGIQPHQIAEAAAKLPASKPISKQFRNTRSSESFDVTVEGVLDDEGWEDVVSELRRSYGTVGTVSQLGSSREWTGSSELFAAHLSATPRGNQTRYRLIVRQEGAVAMAWMAGLVSSLFGSIMAGALVGAKAHAGVAAVLLTILSVILLAYIVVSTVYRRWQQRTLDNATQVLEFLAATPLSSVTERRLQLEAPQELPKLQSENH